ncbi:MAG: FAD-dependent oxidoreductase, partial [Brevinematales bacterium]
MIYDYLIIGSGIVGSLLGRELVRYQNRVLMIEKGVDIGMGTSAANSAIIHAGYDPEPGTLKAMLNVRGNSLWD